jgi:hypothetical protein
VDVPKATTISYATSILRTEMINKVISSIGMCSGFSIGRTTLYIESGPVLRR